MTKNTSSAGNSRAASCANDDLSDLFSNPNVAESIRGDSPSAFEAASEFWRSALSANVLEPRMKELILLALHATVTALNGPQIQRHISRALSAGATKKDILDVLITIAGVANHAVYFALPVLMNELKQLGHEEAELPPMTASSQAIKDDFIAKRGFWNEQRDIVARAMPTYFSALNVLSTQAWTEGSLITKERELICIAIDCSVTHMFGPGLAIHIRNALNKGATRDEILEVFALASATGLEGFVMATEALYSTN